MNIAILNSKGGVGKSTISIQVAAIYLYQKTGSKVEHFEFDDENQDNISFNQSSIVNTNTQKVSKTNLKDKIADILVDNENVVLDVGANKTTVYFLEALITSGMIYAVDLFIVPLTDGETDAVSAVKIYSILKDADADAKVLFALNRVNKSRDINSQFDIFLGDNRGVFNNKGIISSVPEEDRNYIQLEDSDAIKYSKNFGITIWELANIKRDIGKEIKDALNKKVDKSILKTLSFKKAIKDNCISYLHNNLKPILNDIDKIIDK